MHRVTLTVLLVCSVMLSGCGGGEEGPETVTVTGKVTIDGAPVPDGEVIFRPADGGAGRTDAATIKGGEYTMESTLGSKRVEIRAMRNVEGADTSNLETGESGGSVEQYIPEQYNDKSTLTADISESSSPLDFSLTEN